MVIRYFQFLASKASSLKLFKLVSIRYPYKLPKLKVKGAAVESVTMEDLLTVTPSPTSTFIIKTDIEGYDCKVGTVKTFYKV